MFTPQQINQISFDRATFGGYDIKSVDEFLEPLTEDYVTLYKENALLKSKMKVLVSKLEEYRANEESMRDSIVNTQKTCDLMVNETKEKCAAMISEASASAVECQKNADSLIGAEKARVNEARKLAASQIDELVQGMQSCVTALTRIREAAPPMAEPIGNVQEAVRADAVAKEISDSLQALVGTTEETKEKAEPMHPVSDTTAGKFANLKFGPGYDPTRDAK